MGSMLICVIFGRHDESDMLLSWRIRVNNECMTEWYTPCMLPMLCHYLSNESDLLPSTKIALHGLSVPMCRKILITLPSIKHGGPFATLVISRTEQHWTQLKCNSGAYAYSIFRKICFIWLSWYTYICMNYLPTIARVISLISMRSYDRPRDPDG